MKERNRRTRCWDYINSLSYCKNIVTGKGIEALLEFEDDYIPWITNKHISHFEEDVLKANEMNLYNHIDKKLQYDFYINILKPRKRYSEWSKKIENDVLEAIKEYFGYSYDKAYMIMDILTPDQIKEIKKRLERGGLKNDIRHKQFD